MMSPCGMKTLLLPPTRTLDRICTTDGIMSRLRRLWKMDQVRFGAGMPRDFMWLMLVCRAVCDFDATEAIWRHSVESILRIDATEHPLLLVESVFNTAENREKMCEIAMERFQCPAVFIAKDAVLSAFAAGRSTALVLQCGAGITSSVAVHEGYALMQGTGASASRGLLD